MHLCLLWRAQQVSGPLLADFEEAESKWEDGHALYAVWMASSAVTFLSSLFWLQIGFLTGACTSQHLYPRKVWMQKCF